MKILRNTGILLLATLACSCQKGPQELVSPNGELGLTVKLSAEGGAGEPVFAINYKGETVVPEVRLGLRTDRQNYADSLKLKAVSEVKAVTDDYVMLTGKRSHCVNHASEQVYSFENPNGGQLDVTIRAYDDGVAIKYSIPEAAEGENIVDELTTYEVPEGANRWMQEYVLGYEGFYPHSTDGRLPGKPEVSNWGYPGLVELKDSVFMLATEANIRRGHTGSYLNNKEDGDRYQVRLFDGQLPVADGWESPWRVLVVGALSDVVESTLVTDVSDPSKLEDTSWIQPGLVSWIYWAYNHGTQDFQKVKEYIDLAADMGWPYDLIDWEWDQMSNGGDLADAVAYAKERGVKPLLWYNSSTAWLGPTPLYRLNKPEDRAKEFEWLNQLGVYGVKIDFFAGDSVSSMNYYIDLLEDAAKHKLMVNFHGAAIPRGWQRTYPNFVSAEAVYGAEWYNNNGVLTHAAAAHNATLPFTRNVIGPMDYTSGTFSDSQHPHITTYAHELALPVLFESALQCMPDRPEVYAALPDSVKQLLSTLPTAWDDTKLLAGYPGKDVVMARRKGDVWYVAGINGTDEPRTLAFSLDALDVEGGKSISWFKDTADGKGFVTEEGQVEAGSANTVDCLPRGGFVAVVK